MKQGQFRVFLRPLYGGRFTRVHICGCVPTAIPPRLLHRMAAQLALWSGWPVVLALSAEAEAVGWCEVWTDCVKEIPEHHLEFKFLRPCRRASLAARSAT